MGQSWKQSTKDKASIVLTAGFLEILEETYEEECSKLKGIAQYLKEKPKVWANFCNYENQRSTQLVRPYCFGKSIRLELSNRSKVEVCLMNICFSVRSREW